jgi:hypothetical protein
MLAANVVISGSNSVFMQVGADGVLRAYQGASASGALIGSRPVSQIQSLTLTGSGSSGSATFVLNSTTGLSFGSMTLTGGAAMQWAPVSPQVLTLGQLSIDLTSALDIGSNYLDIQTNNSTTAYSAIVPQLSAVRNPGSWTRPGLGTSTAAASQGLAVVQNNQLPSPYSVWQGQSVGLTDLLIAKSWNGDALLTGHLSIDDYLQIEMGYFFGGAGYVNGDFDYNGTVNAADFALIDAAYLAQSHPSAAGNALQSESTGAVLSSTSDHSAAVETTAATTIDSAASSPPTAPPVPVPETVTPVVSAVASVVPVAISVDADVSVAGNVPVRHLDFAGQPMHLPAQLPASVPLPDTSIATPASVNMGTSVDLLDRRAIPGHLPIPLGTILPGAITDTPTMNDVVDLATDFVVNGTLKLRKGNRVVNLAIARRFL